MTTMNVKKAYGHELDLTLANIKQLLDKPGALEWLRYNSLLKHDERIVLECSDFKLELRRWDGGVWVLDIYESCALCTECSDYNFVMQVDFEGMLLTELHKSKLFNSSLTAEQYMEQLCGRIKLLWLQMQPARLYLDKLEEFLSLL